MLGKQAIEEACNGLLRALDPGPKAGRCSMCARPFKVKFANKYTKGIADETGYTLKIKMSSISTSSLHICYYCFATLRRRVDSRIKKGGGNWWEYEYGDDYNTVIITDNDLSAEDFGQWMLERIERRRKNMQRDLNNPHIW